MSNQPSPWGNYQFGPGPGGQNPYSAPSYGGGGQYPPPQEPVSSEAITALVLGLVGLIMWCCPLIGFPVGIFAIVKGSQAAKMSNPTNKIMGIAGIVLGILCLVLSAVNSIAGIIIQLGELQGKF